MESEPDIERLLHHRAWLRALARSLVGEAGTDDLVQDAWLATFQHRARHLGFPDRPTNTSRTLEVL